MRTLAIIALGLWTSACSFNLAPFGSVQPLEERLVFGKKGPKVAMLDIEGVISEASDRGALGISRPSAVARSQEALELAAEDDDVAALLLRIHSPGGTVSASDTIHHQIQRWHEETGRPVVAYLEGIATSGGYFVAMSADTLMAHPTTVTGSIGVIMVNLNLTGLMEKVGIRDQTFTSGPFKDTGSPLRDMRADEAKQLQGVVDDLNKRFRKVVLTGRPALAAKALDKVADGRILTAGQALDSGLIDSIGYFEDAAEMLRERLGVPELRVVTYQRPSEFRSNVYTRAAVPLVDIDILSLGDRLLAPGFYYLWPTLLGFPSAE